MMKETMGRTANLRSQGDHILLQITLQTREKLAGFDLVDRCQSLSLGTGKPHFGNKVALQWLCSNASTKQRGLRLEQ